MAVLETKKGNILEADVEAIVNTVNCVGVMGKGIALQFKEHYPENYAAYRIACQENKVQLGQIFVFKTGLLTNPRYIINFPTKEHWKGRSRLEDIQAGLKSLIKWVEHNGIQAIAVPPLGCGYGGLNWGRVRPVIEAAFRVLPKIRVLLYEPSSASERGVQQVKKPKPPLTRARALYLALMDRYAALDYRRTLLEVHKLAYFLQEDGEPLRLRFAPGHYGPYAENLHKVLETLEGHYTRGFDDSQAPETEIELLPGAVEAARNFLAHDPDGMRRMEDVARLIEGFETPYGLELLATVHWVAKHTEPPVLTEQEAFQRVQEWSRRKKDLFGEEHFRVAWSRLSEEGWLRAPSSTETSS